MRVVLVIPDHEPQNVVAHVEETPRAGEEIELDEESWYVQYIRRVLMSNPMKDTAGGEVVYVICERSRP